MGEFCAIQCRNAGAENISNQPVGIPSPVPTQALGKAIPGAVIPRAATPDPATPSPAPNTKPQDLGALMFTRTEGARGALNPRGGALHHRSDYGDVGQCAVGADADLTPRRRLLADPPLATACPRPAKGSRSSCWVILPLFSVLLKPPIMRTSCFAAGPLSSVAQTSSG